MRLIVWSFMVILLIGFVGAEVKVSCEGDSKCYLINENAYCSQGYCYSHDQGYLTIEDLKPRSNEFEWNVFYVEPKTYRCDDCLMFAPANENWFYKFVSWVLFVE